MTRACRSCLARDKVMVALDRAMQVLNVMLIGPIGSGKMSSVILPNLPRVYGVYGVYGVFAFVFQTTGHAVETYEAMSDESTGVTEEPDAKAADALFSVAVPDR